MQSTATAARSSPRPLDNFRVRATFTATMSHLEPPSADPLQTYEEWYEEAVHAQAPFPDAMALATASKAGRPSVRMVLFKGVYEGCIGFVSNYDSRKGRELAENPAAALAIFWPSLGRQVRFEGLVSRAPDALSDAYFKSRDRESQVGAWASRQSQPIESREALLSEFRAAEARYAGLDVPRPPNWGMYLLEPDAAELWISAEHRLHDRFFYHKLGGAWQCERLSP